MTTNPLAPRTLHAGLVVVDADNGRATRVIAMQYNPDTLTRSLQVQGAGEDGDRSAALRLTGPPVETFKFEAELEAFDEVEMSPEDSLVRELGLLSNLAVLEMLLYPSTNGMRANEALAALGTIEILPQEQPLVLLVWGRHRVVPVRITEYAVTEEAFDAQLRPVRVKVSLSLRVLSNDDLPREHRGAQVFLTYQQGKERLATRLPGGSLSQLGVDGL